MDQCALNYDGTLKDASKITWYEDKDNEVPITSGSVQTGTVLFHSSSTCVENFDILGRGQHTCNTARMEAILQAEQDSDDTVPKPRKRKSKQAQKTQGNHDSDSNDSPFTVSEIDTSSDEDDLADAMEITNEELADLLPSKTVSTKMNHRSTKSKGKQLQRLKKRPRVVQDNQDTLPQLACPVVPDTRRKCKGDLWRLWLSHTAGRGRSKVY
ncbi:hypothetical protein C0992_011216 [Termitomyces sp. T32_za158]|nr:hypothetical protein C0992_011216 [Termitomyces sp. T32_za158]